MLYHALTYYGLWKVSTKYCQQIRYFLVPSLSTILLASFYKKAIQANKKSNAEFKRPAAAIKANGRKTTKIEDPMDVTIDNLWEHCLSTKDGEILTKAFAEYCNKKNITTKDLFLKYSDEERTQAWPNIKSKLLMELVKKIDLVMQEI